MNKQRLEEIKKELLKKKKQQENEWIDYWNNLKPFEENPDRIPDVPIVKDKKQYEEIIVKNLIRCGAIPKERLEVGKTYLGSRTLSSPKLVNISGSLLSWVNINRFDFNLFSMIKHWHTICNIYFRNYRVILLTRTKTINFYLKISMSKRRIKKWKKKSLQP